MNLIIAVIILLIICYLVDYWQYKKEKNKKYKGSKYCKGHDCCDCLYAGDSYCVHLNKCGFRCEWWIKYNEGGEY